MTHYYVSFVVLGRRSDPTLLLGPGDFDVQAEYDEFKDRIYEELGPEPSFLEPRGPYAVRATELAHRLNAEYGCKGDFQAIFIQHLAQRCGFSVVDCRDCRLA